MVQVEVAKEDKVGVVSLQLHEGRPEGGGRHHHPVRCADTPLSGTLWGYGTGLKTVLG